jgi:flavodoxin
MKALVVYESMWGNTEKVADAIAAGLGESMEVELAEVGSAPVAPGPEVSLIVAGGPTHAFSMSRTTTRKDAIDRGAGAGVYGQLDPRSEA